MFDNVVNTNRLHIEASNNLAKASQALKGSPAPFTGKATAFDKEVTLSARIISAAIPTFFHISFDATNVREVSYRLANGPTGAITVQQTPVPVVKNSARVDHVLKPVSAEVIYITVKPASATDLSVIISNLEIHACLEPCKMKQKV